MVVDIISSLARPSVEILKPKFQPIHKYVHNNNNRNYYNNQYNNNLYNNQYNNRRIPLRNHPPAVVSFTTSYFEVFVNGVRNSYYNFMFSLRFLIGLCSIYTPNYLYLCVLYFFKLLVYTQFVSSSFCKPFFSSLISFVLYL